VLAPRRLPRAAARHGIARPVVERSPGSSTHFGTSADSMDSSQVAIATITWTRSPDEEALRRALERFADIGLPVAIADRGTNARVL
jgi:hypothetical protein